jgi:hypothetical protein
MATEKILEITIRGDFELPADIASLSGVPITVSVSAAAVSGYSAKIGSSAGNASRPSVRDGGDHVRLTIEADSVSVAKDETAPPAAPEAPEVGPEPDPVAEEEEPQPDPADFIEGA